MRWRLLWEAFKKNHSASPLQMRRKESLSFELFLHFFRDKKQVNFILQFNFQLQISSHFTSYNYPPVVLDLSVEWRTVPVAAAELPWWIGIPCWWCKKLRTRRHRDVCGALVPRPSVLVSIVCEFQKVINLFGLVFSLFVSFEIPKLISALWFSETKIEQKSNSRIQQSNLSLI